MANERTLSIIKPDAVAKNVIGEIYSRFEKADLKIVAAKMMHLTQEQAEGFYAEHKERPFFNDLVAFMTSGPVVVHRRLRIHSFVRTGDGGGASSGAQTARDSGSRECAQRGPRPRPPPQIPRNGPSPPVS